MFKTFTKTASNTYDDIARQAYGTAEKGGDIAKLNNNIEEGEVLVYVGDEKIKTPDTKTVAIQLGDNLYKDFAEYTLIDILGGVKGAVFVFNKTDIEYDIKMGDEAVVFDESGVFLVGRVANIDNNLDDRANWFQVEIKSHAGVLLESDMAYPLEFSNLSIRNILQSIAQYYNQKISFSDENELDEVFVNEIGTSYTSDTKEKAFNFMVRICRSRGLMITDTGDGLFVGRFKGNETEKLNLIDGACLGVKAIRAVFTGDGLARYYEANSQYPDAASSTVQIPFPIPITKRFNSNDYNAKDLSSIASRLACMDIGEHFKIIVALSENKELKSGGFAIVKNSKIKINNETEFVIERVERKHPDSTLLVLTLPCAYTFQIPSSLPLC